MSKRIRKKRETAGEAKAVTFTPANVVGWNFSPAVAGTKFNYAGEVGDGLGSSVLVALLSWLMRTFPEAPTIVERREKEQWRSVFGHEMSKLIETPNPFYSGITLWMATVLDFAFGNAYWIKVRNGLGEVVQLWWAPASLMEPLYGPQWPDEFIHSYRYRGYLDGIPRELSPDDVVHFRFGMHPNNARIGFTPLTAMMREIYTDDQASNFTASILRNLGIIGVVVSPKAGETIPPDKVNETKEYMQRSFTADSRGKGLVFSRATDVSVLSYNMQGLDVGPIRDIAEERLSATLGIPAAVVGFGTGLQQTKVGATMREMIQQAWNGCLMPMQKIMSAELNRSLLVDFQSNTGIFRTNFDTSEVRALKEDENQKAATTMTLLANGAITVGEARQQLGFDVRPEHDVYYRPTNVTPVATPDEEPEPPPPPPAPPTPATQDPATEGDANVSE